MLLIATGFIVAGVFINSVFDHAGNSPAPLACDRGLRASDWVRDRIATGRAIAKCGWLAGKSRDEVIAALGKPDAHGAVVGLGWQLGTPNPDDYAETWFLGLRFRGGRVQQAYAPLISD